MIKQLVIDRSPPTSRPISTGSTCVLRRVPSRPTASSSPQAGKLYSSPTAPLLFPSLFIPRLRFPFSISAGDVLLLALAAFENYVILI